VSFGPTTAAREGDTPNLALELEADVRAPSLARARIVQFCRDAGWSSSSIATVMLLVSEIVTNAVVHPDVEPPAKIGLCARLQKGTIRVEVSDEGSGFTAKFQDPSQLGGGFGLYLVERESARWGVDASPHTTVWFEVAG
jgi:anti-sigma regulatory factor (Ser/Thr protein kinase)